MGVGYSAPVSINTGVTNLSGSYDNGGSAWNVSGGKIKCTVKTAESTSGCSTTYTPKSSTLILTNNSSNKAKLSFDYVIEKSGDSPTATIDNVSVSSNNKFGPKLLDNGDSIAISINSVSTTSDDSITITLSNIKLEDVVEQSISITLKKPTNGTYTVNYGTNSQTVSTVDILIEDAKTTDSFNFKATPKAGYNFYYRKINDESLNFFNETISSYSFDSDSIIEPIFTNNAIFEVDSNFYDNLELANSKALESSNHLIVLKQSGILKNTRSDGSYNIGNGSTAVTLLVPKDDLKTPHKETPSTYDKSSDHPKISEFRKLVIPENINIVFLNKSSLNVDSQVRIYTNYGAGSPCGPHGRIEISNNANLIFNSGSNLYCWGYITGLGNVKMLSGSVIRECFQIGYFRGGSFTLSNARNSNKILIFNQYFIQNVESNCYIYYGAKELVFTGMVGTVKTTINLIGKEGDGDFMFLLNGSADNYVLKYYDSAKDRLHIDLFCNTKINSFSIQVYGSITVNTSDYVLPITNNISIKVESGYDVSIKQGQDLAFLPSSELFIEKNANFSITSGTNFYVYDESDWGNYASSSEKRAIILYSSTLEKKPTSRAAEVDAKIDINGSLQVNGKAYTTSGGANICSSGGTGVFKLNNAPTAETTTYQFDQGGSSTKVSISCTAAKLKNGVDDPTYTETKEMSANTIVNYVNNIWGGNAGEDQILTLKFYDVNDTLLYVIDDYNCENEVQFPSENDIQIDLSSNYSLKFWIDEENGNPLLNNSVGRGEYSPGQNYQIPSDFGNSNKEVIYKAFYGGRRGEGSQIYYVDFNSGNRLEGIVYLCNEFGEYKNIELNTLRFFSKVSIINGEIDGGFLDLSLSKLILYKKGTGSDSFINGDDNYYFILNGIIVKDSGVYQFKNDNLNKYCFIDQTGTCIKNGVFYIDHESMSNYGMTKGFYYFENGIMVIPSSPININSASGIIFDVNNNICYDYGLFELNGYLYYADTQGKIVKNCTYYVTKTNNYKYKFSDESQATTIQAGLYYFDSNGHMYSQDMREITEGITNE